MPPVLESGRRLRDPSPFQPPDHPQCTRPERDAAGVGTSCEEPRDHASACAVARPCRPAVRAVAPPHIRIEHGGLAIRWRRNPAESDRLRHHVACSGPRIILGVTMSVANVVVPSSLDVSITHERVRGVSLLHSPIPPYFDFRHSLPPGARVVVSYEYKQDETNTTFYDPPEPKLSHSMAQLRRAHGVIRHQRVTLVQKNDGRRRVICPRDTPVGSQREGLAGGVRPPPARAALQSSKAA